MMGRSRPLVSVISSVYNVSNYIEATLQSVVNQDYPNIEVIVVDDGSTDDTYSKLLEFKARDSRVKVIRNTGNQGPSAKNLAIKEANGSYIAIMDGDDLYHPSRISLQVKLLEDYNDCVACSCHAITFGARKNLIRTFCTPEQIKAHLLINMPMVHPGLMLRAAIIKKNNILYNGDIRFIQDYDFVNRISQYGLLRNVNRVLVYYRRHPSQVTATREGFLQMAGAYILPFKKEQLRQIGIDLSMRDLQVYLKFCYNEPLTAGEFIDLTRILQIIRMSHPESKSLKYVFGIHLLHFLKKNPNLISARSMVDYLKIFGGWNIWLYLQLNVHKKLLKYAQSRNIPI